MWPLAKGKEVLSFYRYFAKEAPDELNTLATLLTDPQGAAVVAIGLCYAGPVTQGEKVVGPLRALGPPLADLVRPMAYCEVQRMIRECFRRLGIPLLGVITYTQRSRFLSAGS
jgi:hypothetical protein